MDTERLELPASFLGHDRVVELGYSYHGDFQLALGNTTTAKSGDDHPENLKAFRMAHGSDVTLFALMIGYYRYLGHDEGVVRDTFRNAADSILDESEALVEGNNFPRAIWSLESVMQGTELTAFSNNERNWKALTTPIPSQPGVVAKVGGTGVYAMSDIFGNDSLLLASIPPNYAITTEEENTKTIVRELCQADIPIVARAICEVALGEYRTNIATIAGTL